MNKIQKIAKRITARSQMLKFCSIYENEFHGKIKQSIFLQQNNYKFFEFTNNIYSFFYDVKREIENIVLNIDLDVNEILLKIDANQLLTFTYEIKTNISEKQKQKIKLDEWIVTDLN